MARQNNYKSRGNLALKPEVDKTAASKYTKRGNVLSPNFKKTGIEKDLKDSGKVLNFPTSNTISMNKLRQNENAPVKDPLNYNQDNKTSGQSTTKENTKNLKSLAGFFGRHKKASIGGLAGILIGGVIAIFGTLLSGPMSIIHAGEFVSDIANGISDATSAARMARNTSKAMKTVSTNRQNARVNTVSKLMARSYEKALKKAGIELVSDEAGAFTHFEINSKAMSVEDVEKAGMKVTSTTKDGKMIVKFDGGTNAEKSKIFRNTMKNITEKSSAAKSTFLTKSKMLSSMSTRILGKMNLTVGFHPIQKLTAKIMTTNGGKLLTRAKHFDKTLNEFIEKKALSLARRAEGKLVAKTANKVASKAAQGVLKVITTGLKASVVGAVFGVAIDFIAGLVIERVTSVGLETNLNIAEGKAMEIMATASQIKSGDFPTETEIPDSASGASIACDEADETEDCYEESTPMDELDTFTRANLYRETNTVSEELSTQCNLPEEPTEDEIEKCISDYNGKTEVEVSNFWSSAGVKHETGNPSANKMDGSVPVELMTDKDSPKEWMKDIGDALMESIVFVSPGMFESDGYLSTEDASPIQVGSIATFGARAASNTKMLASGGNSYEEGSLGAITIENERKEYLAQEFAEKPLIAKLFDVEDYQSAIVTLAHNSGWDISNSSFSTQLKNIGKTFASLPNLISGSFNKMSYASANTSSDFYGFGTVGYTNEELTNLPDFDVAAEGVSKFNDEIITDNLPKVGVDDITATGRVKYKEDTDAEDIDVRAENTALKLGNGSHTVILCNNGDFVWKEDGDTCESTKTYDENGILVAGEVTYTTDQIIRAYLLDYPLLMSSAAEDYAGLCDGLEGIDKQNCDADTSEASSYLDEAMSDMGISTGSTLGSGSSGGGNSEFNSETIQEEFQKTGCKYGGYSVGSNGCTTIPVWFVGEYTNLKYGRGNGGDVASNLASANGLSTTKTPVAPAIFSSRDYNSSSYCGSIKCGHTGLVTKVEGDNVTVLETWSSFSGQNPCSRIKTFKASDYDITYVNLGEHLK